MTSKVDLGSVLWAVRVQFRGVLEVLGVRAQWEEGRMSTPVPVRPERGVTTLRMNRWGIIHSEFVYVSFIVVKRYLERSIIIYYTKNKHIQNGLMVVTSQSATKSEIKYYCSI